MKMDYFLKIGKKAGIEELAEHETAGTLIEFISDVAPEYIECGIVLKFNLLADLGWL
jgi:hypothetical protein